MTSTTPRAVAPATDPPSFPDPVFFPARRIHGLVETPEPGAATAAEQAKEEQAFAEGGRPPALQRRNSVTGNVLLLEHAQEGTKAFMLQRKVGTSAYGGSVRVGFCLHGDKPSTDDGLWRVVLKDGSGSSSTTNSLMELSRKRDHAMMEEDIRDRCEMVTVYIENEMTLMGVANDPESNATNATDTLKTEMAALQWIAQHSETLHLDHLWGSTYMGNDSGWICAILSPWSSDGTLLDYCASHPNGTPPLEEAKFFFKQILQVCCSCLSVSITDHNDVSVLTLYSSSRLGLSPTNV